MRTLGQRIKEDYEIRQRVKLPRRTNTIVRIDGKAFHTLTKSLEKPFDAGIEISMDYAGRCLADEFQGAKMVYIQSDEISIWATDYDNLETGAWFDGNVQKISSVSASVVTANFNRSWGSTWGSLNTSSMAYFDARVFTIAERSEVANYFLWRYRDAVKNAISMIAERYYSSRELHGVSSSDRLGMIGEDRYLDYKKGSREGRLYIRHGSGESMSWICSECPKDFSGWNEKIEIAAPKQIQ
jgi:tRNA(His) 5'-end guanylyltransferase